MSTSYVQEFTDLGQDQERWDQILRQKEEYPEDKEGIRLLIHELLRGDPDPQREDLWYWVMTGSE